MAIPIAFAIDVRRFVLMLVISLIIGALKPACRCQYIKTSFLFLFDLSVIKGLKDAFCSTDFLLLSFELQFLALLDSGIKPKSR